MSDQVRVMLVGRTSFDAVLRRDPAFELVRPRGVLDAIGELAEAIEPGDARPTYVFVAADAISLDRAEGFASAVRRIDPGARIYGVNGDASVPSGFDGVVPPSATAAAIMAITAAAAPKPVGSNGKHTAPAISHKPVDTARPLFPTSKPDADIKQPLATVPSAPQQQAQFPRTDAQRARGSEQTDGAPLPPATTPARANVNVHERTPLGALLAGRDPVESALTSIRTMRGVDVQFVTPSDDQPAPAASVPVEYAGRTYGVLSAPGVPHEQVVQDASWLAGWAALAAQQDQLRRAAFTDELTGAFNRRYFQRFLAAAIEQAREARRAVALLAFDIDNFKLYNDKYGHAAGDEILVETVRLLKGIIRPSDRVCRVGGDEFAVIFHDPEGPRRPDAVGSAQGLSSIADIARRFQKQVLEHRFPKLAAEAPGTLTISGGMATYPWDGQSPADLLERADLLALQSKRQGKNVITLGPGVERLCSSSSQEHGTVP